MLQMHFPYERVAKNGIYDKWCNFSRVLDNNNSTEFSLLSKKLGFDRFEIHMTGVGGQGIRLAGHLIGNAATLDGRFATQWQSYGVETRGGPSSSDVVISDHQVDYPRVERADVLAITHPKAIYDILLKESCAVFIDENIREIPPVSTTVKKFPIVSLAHSMGNPLLAGIITVGVIVGVSGAVTTQSVKSGIRMLVSRDLVDLNVKAFEYGLSLA